MYPLIRRVRKKGGAIDPFSFIYCKSKKMTSENRPFIAYEIGNKMTEQEDVKVKTPLYKDTITELNRLHRYLTYNYLIGDTRAVYLKQFELVLSLNCPNGTLWEMERYVRISKKYPLPDDVEKYVSRKHFYLYLMLYDYLMRDIGLIGKKETKGPNMKMFDMRT